MAKAQAKSPKKKAAQAAPSSSSVTKLPHNKKKSILRALAKKEPLLVENTKRALIMKGNRTSQVILEVLTDLSKLLKPNCRVMGRKNEIHPFEDANSIEFLTSKNDCSLFAVGSHSKKRPNNLILGRTYDGHMLDMIEFGVDAHTPLETFKGSKKAMGSKPLMSFLGEQWESDSTFVRIQNLLLDVFRGDKIDMISLKGMDHVLVFTVVESRIMLRGHTLSFKKSGTKVPKVELLPMGPYMDLVVRRTQLAADDLFKISCKRPKRYVNRWFLFVCIWFWFVGSPAICYSCY